MNNQVVTCEHCHLPIDSDATAAGWPIATSSGAQCPSCYGDEAFCIDCGAVLPAREEGPARCRACNASAVSDGDWVVCGATAEDLDWGQVSVQEDGRLEVKWVGSLARTVVDPSDGSFSVYETRREAEEVFRARLGALRGSGVLTVRDNVLARLSDLDRGDGCLGVVVDAVLRDYPTASVERAAEIARESLEDAEAEARVEREDGGAR